MNTLWEQKKVNINELQDKCLEISNKLQKIEGWLYSEFTDASKFKIFIGKLLEDRYLKEDPDKKLSALRITKKVQKDFKQFFNQKFMSEVNQLNVRE